ncbi:MAG: hypothetical protein MJB57_16225 [Gemmatimonadetes bacterium]|nr:hypothetical protein [Gemmatimonadota bacterium]
MLHSKWRFRLNVGAKSVRGPASKSGAADAQAASVEDIRSEVRALLYRLAQELASERSHGGTIDPDSIERYVDRLVDRSTRHLDEPDAEAS